MAAFDDFKNAIETLISQGYTTEEAAQQLQTYISTAEEAQNLLRAKQSIERKIRKDQRYL
jgi:predicted RNase H-like HicB family nuclease